MKSSNLLKTLALALSLMTVSSAKAERQDFLINSDWSFRFSHSVQRGVERRVDLPHTWNAQDALSGKHDYKRGIGNYKKQLFIDSSLQGKRLFLRFEGANSVATLLVNHQWVGEHRGGYGAFVFEITDLVKYGEKNLIEMRVNNGEQLDIMPLVGDFNMYGGIYRDAHLLVTDQVCISPLNMASPGLRLMQENVSERSAHVRATVDLLGGREQAEAQLTVKIKAGGKTIAEKSQTVALTPNVQTVKEIEFDIANPHLWNGREDPFLYQVEATLATADGRFTDTVSQNIGLRYYRIDPNEGFFLNGRHLPLHGVCRHQDRAEIANALHQQHHEEDLQIIMEMGANAIRLSHYPHAQYFYDLLDKNGIIAWSEIPFVGPGGYDDTGFVNSPSFRENGRLQLEEMILQHGNHPSVVVWGIFNELQPVDAPENYVSELNALAHKLDPTRPTTAASNVGGGLNFITDVMAWNKYDGWYGSTPATLATWLDATHKAHPELCIALSEYGAGASIYQQQDSLVQSSPTSWWHPENWQLEYHIKNWEIISSRPFLWGTFIWNMFDFGAAHRTEGDRPGINDKGLVTYDRKTRKDVFYFYKANWNPEPMLYLTDRRCTRRTKTEQNFRAFTTLPEAELFVNGKSVGRAKPNSLHIAEWGGVKLEPGRNEIRVEAKQKGIALTDSYSVEL